MRNSEQTDSEAGAFDAIMGDPGAPDGSLRRKIMDFAVSVDCNGKHIRRARKEWDGDDGVDYNEPDGGPNFLALMDYFVHDYHFPGESKSMLDLFHAARGRDLPQKERELLEGWLNNRKACYEVEEVRPGLDAVLRDLLTERRHKVYSQNASRRFVKRDLLYARLTKLGDGWEMTGTAQVFAHRHKDRVVAHLRGAFEALRRETPSATLETYLKTSAPKIKRFLEALHREDSPKVTTATGRLVAFLREHLRAPFRLPRSKSSPKEP